MSDTILLEDETAPEPGTGTGRSLLRVLGLTLVAAGSVLLLYVVYLLWFTGVETDRVQERFLTEWELEVGEVEGPGLLAGEQPGAGPDSGEESQPVTAVPEGEALAVVWFERPATGEDPVLDEPVFVVEGTTAAHLRRGPGHYVDTALPGEDGNFAISGHRTTYSAPFFDLDDVEAGDLVHVTDRAGVTHTYEVVEEVVVPPTAIEVIGEDPLGTGRPLLTITTCHPRFSDAERLVVHAELVA